MEMGGGQAPGAGGRGRGSRRETRAGTGAGRRANRRGDHARGRSLGNDRTDGRTGGRGRDADWGRQSLAIDRLHKFKVWKPNFEHGAGIVG